LALLLLNLVSSCGRSQGFRPRPAMGHGVCASPWIRRIRSYP
jgi:hypothetical protein